MWPETRVSFRPPVCPSVHTYIQQSIYPSLDVDPFLNFCWLFNVWSLSCCCCRCWTLPFSCWDFIWFDRYFVVVWINGLKMDGLSYRCCFSMEKIYPFHFGNYVFCECLQLEDDCTWWPSVMWFQGFFSNRWFNEYSFFGERICRNIFQRIL